ncbi:MAG: (d)CMP kinase [Anaerolineales bacterium]|nr:MAG: (d)CMP kinase [Anaerolineales bacterium]
MTRPSLIAIDGAAASGKSTVGCILARRLGYMYFDTGVMYRAVTWATLERGIPTDDEAAVTSLAESLVIEVTPPTQDDDRQYTVYADGQDVTWAIRQPAVDAAVSQISAYPGVRQALTLQQRRIAASGHMVMVGRDIGTVVLPAADLKLYIQASVEERARRRYQECQARGEDVTYQEVLASMRRRDQIDSQRAHAPLRVARDAVIIDTDGLGIEEVLARIEPMVKNQSES